jgi:hypothetical protein
MKPKQGDKKNYIGVEIECYGLKSNHSKLLGLFKEEGVTNNTQIVGDGSIRVPSKRVTERYHDWYTEELRTRTYNRYDDKYKGYEVRVFMEEAKVSHVLTRVFRSLNKLGFGVNKSCGLHVHFDMRNKSGRVSGIYENLQRCLGLLAKLQKRGRARNQYCTRNKYDNFVKHLKYDDRKYRAINTQCLRTKNTMEVRIGHGTLDARETIDWVKLLLTIINKKKPIEKKVVTINDFSKLVTKRKDLTTKVKARYNTYNKVA